MLNPVSYISSSKFEVLKSQISEVVFGGLVSKDHIFLTENGRSAMYLILNSLDIKAGDKVLVQPFTCNSAVSPILWNSLIPGYVDIDYETLNMSPAKCRKAIDSDNTIKAVIVQHTFGRPSDILGDLDYIRSKGILVIEDCAHALGVDYENKVLGSIGDAAILSFGLEKVLPTKVGGAAIINNQELIENFSNIYSKTKKTSLLRSKLWILNPLLRVVTRKIGRAGSFVIAQLSKLGLFNVGFVAKEFIAEKPSYYPRAMSKVIAAIVSLYLSDLQAYVDLMKRHSSDYKLGLESLGYGSEYIKPGIAYLKYPIYLKDDSSRISLSSALKSNGFYTSSWYEGVIYPLKTDLQKYQYRPGSCPNADLASNTVLNLPTGEAFSPNILEFLEAYSE